MEIIYHTADMNKDILTLENVFHSGIQTVELDFVMSKDGIPVWTHNILPTQVLNYNSKTIKDYLTLYDVLDLNNHRCKLMLDLKYISKNILNSKEFSKLLNYLNQYDDIQIQSLDLSLINKIDYSNIEVGLIINVLSKWYINNKMKLPDLDFMSISSELWERKNGIFIEKCNELYPKVKKYGWTWSTREEDEDRINNFINKEADGIITSNPKLVKQLIKKGSYD